MPNVTVDITVPDALVTRVQTALGVSTKAEFQDWVRARVKEAVISYESNQAFQTANADLAAAQIAHDVAVENAKAAAEAEINLL